LRKERGRGDRQLDPPSLASPLLLLLEAYRL
jgi:hypothetical protein